MILLKRLSTIDERRLETSSLAVDSQLKHLAIYDVNQDCVYLLSPIMVLHYMLDYKRDFAQHKKYRIKRSLPYHRAIRGFKGSTVFKMFFSTSINGKDMLTLVYYDGSLEIYESRNNWTKVLGYNFDGRIAGATLLTSQQIYTVGFDLRVDAYTIHGNGSCSKAMPIIKKAKSILIGTKEGVLYEDEKGALICGKQQLLPASKAKVRFYHRYQSVDDEEVDPENFEISACQRYLIRMSPCTVYELNREKSTIIKVLDIEGEPSGVYPSPFNYQLGSVAAVTYSGWLEVLVLVPNPTDKGKCGEVLLEITELKSDLEKIVWISPYHLLLVSVDERLYYLQIQSNKLLLPSP